MLNYPKIFNLQKKNAKFWWRNYLKLNRICKNRIIKMSLNKVYQFYMKRKHNNYQKEFMH